MSYITDLRKYVGHDPLIGIGATTLVFNDKKEILLNLRSDTLNWGIPGGSIELNETIEETAIRELKARKNKREKLTQKEKSKLSLFSF